MTETAHEIQARAMAKGETPYVIFFQKTEADPGATQTPAPIETWRMIGTVNARGPEAAIKQHAEKTGQDGSYAAVPKRNWTPLKIAKKVTTTFEVA